MTTALDQFTLERVNIDSVIPNPWNPNQQDKDTFDRLAKDIDEVGYIAPIQVVAIEDGKYRIIGGEHRWKAMRARGESDIDVLVLKGERWADEDLQKFATVRQNVIHGKMSQQKFAELYMSMSTKYTEQALQALMGFTDEAAFSDAKKLVSKEVLGGITDPDIKKKAAKAIADAKTVDSLSTTLNEIMSKHGKTLDRHFMIFVYGGKRHIFIDCDAATFATAKELTDFCNERGVSVRSTFAAAMADWKNRVEITPADKSE